jgi:hypothetical protein
MIVYDVTDEESFRNVSSWLIEVEKYLSQFVTNIQERFEKRL